MSRRGRVYAKNIGANAANGSDSAFAGGRFIKMNRRGRLCKKNIAENAENEAIQRLPPRILLK